jgi:predicted outer membrane lipoprotein
MYPKTVFFTILGLLVASPFSIIYATCNEYTISFDFWTIFFSVISFAFGLGLVIFGEYMSNKTRIENKE